MPEFTTSANWTPDSEQSKSRDVGLKNSTYTDPVEQWRELLTPEFFELVPDFWLHFPPPSEEAHQTLGVLYTLIMVPGILGNALIIWLVCSTKTIRTPSNFLVVNLAISDFCMLAKMPIFIYNSFCQKPALGVWACQLYGFLGGITGTSAIMTIAAMAFERYYSISRPLDLSGRMTRARASTIVICVWIYAFIFSVLPLFHVNRYVPEGYLSSCSFDYLARDLTSRLFVLVFFIAAWCVPLVIICVSYCGIILTVRRNQQLFRNTVSQINSKRSYIQKHRNTEIKLAKISVSLISLWMISWTPYAVVALFGISFNYQLLTPTTSMVPALFCKTASVVDPFLYGLSHPRFKSELKKKIICLYVLNKFAKQKESFNIPIPSHVSDESSFSLQYPSLKQKLEEPLGHQVSTISRCHQDIFLTDSQSLPPNILYTGIEHQKHKRFHSVSCYLNESCEKPLEMGVFS
ncbi:opsin, ultraviolet-sensitive-like [Limulus polyphemus]|uniref:Opsin, ultraviolet-sensitive-like n=1 Tax=Limulus polyphemus TaxID=6850 RepID=A0ABM1S8Y5_LIMPO|nr:opsin, ultraviolet-sensitive-like [Limulus polyphemus]